MQVSIIVNNYNYAAYVASAIDSALAQTWRDCEVIVVDDGSTDDSWGVIQRYGARIRAIRQPNGGQGAAYNTGFAASSGRFVLMLDADDLLDPTAVERCMSAMQDEAVSHVQFRLRLMEADGSLRGGFTPYLMHDGDVSDTVRRYGHYAGPPSSGNFYRRSAIEAGFPLDAPRFRRAADTVPFLTSAFFGRVVSIREPLGSYRLHRSSGGRAGIFGNISASYRDQLLTIENRRGATLEALAVRTGIRVAGPFLPLPWSLRTRALSWRLQRDDHPYPGDTPATILRLQRESLRHWPGYSAREKALMTGWVAAALILPRPLVERLAASNTAGGTKAAVKRLLGTAR